MKLYITTIILATISFQTICGQITLSSQKIEALDAIFSDFEGRPGVAVGIYHAGEVLFGRGYGLANLDEEIPITTETLFETASVSKQFTAACIYLLEMEGKLSLDDPIQRFLPEFPTYGDRADRITIRHLLHHSSGVRSYLKLLFLQGKPWDNHINNTRFLRLMQRQQDINFTPGERYAYSNSGYVLLALIVERASGQTLGAYAGKHLFEPLGMNHTFINEDPRQVVRHRALGYEGHEGSFRRLHYYNAATTGDGGVYTNIQDFFKWSENFATPEVGGTRLIEKMLTRGRLNGGEEHDYAGGLVVRDYRGLPTLGHDGEWAGFRSVFFKFPAEDVAFVLLSNNSAVNVWALIERMIAVTMPDKFPVTQMQNLPQTNNNHYPATELQRFAGSYFNAHNGQTRKILLEKDTLVYQVAAGRSTKLVPVGEQQFSFITAPQIIADFGGPEGTLAVTVGNQPPMQLKKFVPRQYTAEELFAYTGNYHCAELEVEYRIEQREEQLCIAIDGEHLVCLSPLMENIFAEEHFGYLEFTRSEDGGLAGFTVNDELARDLYFIRAGS